MNNILEFMKIKVMPKILRFINSKAITALKDGMLCILPLTVVGSIFLVIGQIPSKTITSFLVSNFGENWNEPLMQVVGGTFAIMGLVSCFAIAYSYAKNSNITPIPAGVLAISSFFITSNSYIISPESHEKVTDVISKAWTGGQGMITAIIIGLSVGYIYTWFIKRNIVIKLHPSVPPTVSAQFIAFIPAFVIFSISMLVYIIFKHFNTTLLDAIYNTIQIPLQGLTDSLGGAIAIAFFISFIWWFGVHGQSVVNGIVTSILTANALGNAQIYVEQGHVSLQNGGHIVTQQFLDTFLLFTGSGITFGIVFAMLFWSKSNLHKSLGKACLFPAIFNINEPVTFGFGIVYNPLMIIPFILTPILSCLLVYGAIYFGFVAPFSGMMLPWSTPGIISGFLVAGWKGALLQILILIISVVVYYPFFKKQDEITLAKEIAEAKIKGEVL